LVPFGDQIVLSSLISSLDLTEPVFGSLIPGFDQITVCASRNSIQMSPVLFSRALYT
jgi:hypothetical protein